MNKLNLLFSPLWVTGFSDGEATFGVNVSKSSTHKVGYRVKVWFSVPQDARDLKVLEALRDFFNVGSVSKDSGDRNVWVYKVSSHIDIFNVIIPFFDKHPLLSSKIANYGDFKKIVLMMINQEHLTQKGLDEIMIISRGMNTNRDYSLLNRPDFSVSADWILGFVDAEGCFYAKVTPNKTSKLGYRVILSFSIFQHERDYYILEAIKNYFGCGSIVKRTKGKNPSFEFRIVGINDLSDIIIPFFEEHCLITTKIANYKDLSIIVKMCRNQEHLTQSGLNKIKHISEGMNTGRHY